MENHFSRLPLIFLLAAFIAVLLAGCTSQQPAPAGENQGQKAISIGANGLLAVPQDRGPVQAVETPNATQTNYTVTKIAFQSAGGRTVYALLDLPTANGKPVSGVPAAVFMPGLGVNKEGGNIGVAKALAQAGFAVITVDQFGVGETGGVQVPLDKDFAAFSNGSYSQQHLMVYDYLRAFDYLRGRPEVDAKRVVFAGESHGGRIAIIAAALEPAAKGALVISTAGYSFLSPPREASTYLASVNPDSYVARLGPRKIVFMHSPNDRGVPIEDGRKTYGYASDPREFIEIPCEFHGYCTQIAGLVAQKAKELAG